MSNGTHRSAQEKVINTPLETMQEHPMLSASKGSLSKLKSLLQLCISPSQACAGFCPQHSKSRLVCSTFSVLLFCIRNVRKWNLGRICWNNCLGSPFSNKHLGLWHCSERESGTLECLSISLMLPIPTNDSVVQWRQYTFSGCKKSEQGGDCAQVVMILLVLFFNQKNSISLLYL